MKIIDKYEILRLEVIDLESRRVLLEDTIDSLTNICNDLRNKINRDRGELSGIRANKGEIISQQKSEINKHFQRTLLKVKQHTGNVYNFKLHEEKFFEMKRDQERELQSKLGQVNDEIITLFYKEQGLKNKEDFLTNESEKLRRKDFELKNKESFLFLKEKDLEEKEKNITKIYEKYRNMLDFFGKNEKQIAEIKKKYDEQFSVQRGRIEVEKIRIKDSWDQLKEAKLYLDNLKNNVVNKDKETFQTS